jgi:hypothetical protein
MDKLNKNRPPPLRFGIGLHPHAHRVHRGRGGSQGGQWKSLGSHTLRGVGDKIELFTLP